MKKREFLTALGGAIMAVPVAASVAKNSKDTESQTHASLMNTVREKGELRAGYVNYAPGFSVDPNSKQFSGIFHDAVEQMAKTAGIKIDWSHEATFATLFEGFKTGKYDAVCSGIWVNGPRTVQGDFSDPLYYSGISAYVRADDHRFKDVENLNSSAHKLATIDGEMTSVIAAEHFPQAQTLSLSHDTSVSEVLVNVVNKKADATFVEDDVANKFLQQNPNSLKKLKTIFAIPTSVLLPPEQAGLKAFFNQNIELLNNTGALEKIIAKYETTPDTLLRLAKPYQDS